MIDISDMYLLYTMDPASLSTRKLMVELGMSHLVFNSVPRSGQVFLSHVAQEAFSMPMSTAHLPEIFGVKELYHVSIFRKPEDCIASLINKRREVSADPDFVDKQQIEITVSFAVQDYDRYITGVSNNLDNVQPVLFTEVAEDSRTVIQKIADRFSLNIRDGYESRISLDESSRIWSDKFDGHVPRPKDNVRLEIEALVASLDSVKSLNDRYLSFLATFCPS